MSYLLRCNNVSKSFGAQTLFANIDFVVHSGDRIGLIGPNGSGKSTLMQILCRLVQPDSGGVQLQKYVTSSYLAQEDVFLEDRNAAENLYAVLDSGLNETEQYNRVQALLSRAEFIDRESEVRLLSGGWRKRLAICRALVTGPDVLVIDEPTNHLDLEGILWLERMLKGSWPGSPDAVVFVSHDRRFLENTANQIVELSAVYPDGSLQVKGNYSEFLERRQEYLIQQQNYEERLSNKMRRETEWLRRGPKARATKAQYRIDEAGRLQDELSKVRTRNRSQGQVDIKFDETKRKTKQLMVGSGLGKAYDGVVLFSDLDIVLSPGTRIGLLGRNGCGKSTLMDILASAGAEGGHVPDQGKVTAADKIQIVSFDQRRQQIDPNVTLRRALAPDGDSIVYQDRSIHVAGWANRFLFRADQLETPVGRLSGGEQARVLIAALMRQPADILLLDEPTNDLDIASLDILEESLLEFRGALVLVTHDRFLLDRVCDQVLGFDGKGEVTWFADYHQWLDDMQETKDLQKSSELKGQSPGSEKSKEKGVSVKAGKLSYMDQREYDQLEEKIQQAEDRETLLRKQMDSSEVQADHQQLDKVWQELQDVENLVQQLYERWEELEDIKSAGGS